MIQRIAVTPDGASVIYGRRVIEGGKYRARIWRVAVAGGEPEQLTAADSVDSSPRVSPDGRTLLFLSDRDEPGVAQPYVMPLSGGEPRRVHAFPKGVQSAEWSPDGSKLLILAPSGEERFIVGDPKDPTARRITGFTWRMDGAGILDQNTSVFVLPVDGGEPIRVTNPAETVGDACWSPDGARIAYTADRDPDAELRVFGGSAKLWGVAADGSSSEPELLAALPGQVEHVAWSDHGLAIIGTNHPSLPNWALHRLFIAAPGGEPREVCPDLDRPFTTTSYGDLIDPSSDRALQWLPDGSILSILSDEGRALPVRVQPNGTIHRLADGELTTTAAAAAAAGGTIAYVATDRGIAGEIYVVEADAPRRLTTHGSDWLDAFRFDPVRVRVPHPDGHTVDAFFIEGRNAPKPGPTVVQLHGGPHASHGPTPWLEMIALADAGFHVFYPNPRGSTSYGEDFARAIHGDWGNPDASDIMHVIDWAIDEGIADASKVGVFGLSGGGYMTTWLLGQHPGRFAAAVSENPVTNLVSMWGSSDLAHYYGERFVGAGELPENIEDFLRMSPFMKLHLNKAPLLLLHCDGDLRCPPEQSEAAFHILRHRGVTVEMVRYPQEPHYLVGIGRPDRRIDRIQRHVAWFQTHMA